MQRRQRVPEKGRGTPVVVGSAVIVLFALVALASALQGRPQFRATNFELGNGIAYTPLPEPSSTGEPLPRVTDTPWWVTALSVVLGAALALALIVLLVFLARLLVRAVRDLWQSRSHSIQGGVDLTVADASGPSSEQVPDAVHVRRGIATALREISAGTAPSDSIVAAWVGVEQAAADAGVTRGTSETAAELSLRVIAHRSKISAETQELLALYEKVRFGGYLADEGDRDVARRLLERIAGEWQ